MTWLSFFLVVLVSFLAGVCMMCMFFISGQERESPREEIPLAKEP